MDGGNFALIIFFLLLAITLVFIALIFFRVIRPVNPPPTSFQAQIAESVSLQAGFSSPVPTPCTDNSPTSICRGQCLIYETFSQETDIVNNLTPVGNINDPTIPAAVKCNDGFTMALQQMISTCQDDLCIGLDGASVTSGGTETFYTTCGNMPTCSSDFRSAIVFNYQQTGTQLNPQAVCMVANPETNPATFSSTPPGGCPTGVSLDDQVFLNIAQDQQTIMIGTTPVTVDVIQIRAPLSDDCLINQNGDIIPAPCQSVSSGGFEWIYIAAMPSPGNPDQTIPSQILYDDPTVTNPFELQSLQVETSSNTFVLSDFQTCSTSSLECFGTQIISAQAWTCVN